MAWRSCSVLFRPTGGALFRSSVRGGRSVYLIVVLCVSTRWPHSLQQRCGFKKVSRKPEPKKLEDPGPAHTETPKAVVQRQTPTPTVDRQVPLRSPRGFGRLVRPFFFTVGFTGCSFGSAAIWQYESLKSRVQSYFNDVRADWLEKVRPQKRGDVRKEINQWWHSLTEGQRTVTGIIAVNAIVFCCWRVPSLQRFMVRYFTSNPASRVVSTFVSYVCKMATGRFSPSLGAALKGIVAMDTAGLVLGWRFFDHAAHLGGAMFGIWYILFGHELIWKNREPFVKVWHELRTRGGGGGRGGAV
uniref:Presenilin associated rhomboid like n=1 Tax=Kryptolebias marmoratus TaxID=37003 RepID=A0A3Q3AVW7_KRYMA